MPSCRPAPPRLQLTQLPGTSLGGQPQQWVEALLLQAAESVGFSGKRAPPASRRMAAVHLRRALGAAPAARRPAPRGAVPVLRFWAPCASMPFVPACPALPDARLLPLSLPAHPLRPRPCILRPVLRAAGRRGGCAG